MPSEDHGLTLREALKWIAVTWVAVVLSELTMKLMTLF